jgi:hypothetical protein
MSEVLSSSHVHFLPEYEPHLDDLLAPEGYPKFLACCDIGDLPQDLLKTRFKQSHELCALVLIPIMCYFEESRPG